MRTYSTLVSQAETYAESARLLGEMKGAGIAPNVVTYNTLVSQAETYAEAARLLEEMKAAGIAPDVVTYNTLVSKADSYAESARLLEEMTAAGIAPDVVTYTTLVSQAETYAEANRLLEEMKAAGIAPDVVTYTALFRKDIGEMSARDILDWYRRQEDHPLEPLNALIASLRKAQRIADALEVALEHPALSSARRLMRLHPKKAQEAFEAAKNSDPMHPTADFALGALYLGNGDSASARRCLQNALKAVHDPEQKETISTWLTDLERAGE